MPLGPGKDKGLQPSAIRSVVAKDAEGGSPTPLSDDEHLRRSVGVAAPHRLPGRENEPTEVSRQKARRRKRHRFLSSAPRVWKQPHDMDAGVGAGLMSHSRGAQPRPTFEVPTGQSRRTFFSLASSIVTVAMGVLNFCSVNAQGQRHLMGKIEVIGPCTVHDGFCFQSPNYPSSYAKNQSCTITVTSAAGPDDILMVEAFNTVSDSDILTVGSTEYSGWGGPLGVVASEGLEITWRSSALERSSINNRRKLGFSICLVPECMHGDGAKANDGRCSCGHTSLCTPASKSYCYSPQSLCAEYPNPRKSFLTVTSGVCTEHWGRKQIQDEATCKEAVDKVFDQQLQLWSGLRMHF
eukprot:g291.t1